MEPIIRIQNLVKQYGSYTALNIDSLDITAGEAFGLVGNNGAGKTTLFRLILDLIPPSGGAVYSRGEGVALREHWKGYTSAFIDESYLMDYLSPEEYFQFIGKLHGLDKPTIAERLSGWEDFFNGEILNRKKYIRDLSKGNQKKVGIVAALLGNPEVVLLDEPFANLDPSTQYRLRDRLKQMDAESDVTLLVSSHDLGHVTEFCQRIVILDKGTVLKDIRTNAQTLAELEAYFTGRGEVAAEPGS